MDIEIEREQHGRWIAEVFHLPGVISYGQSPEEAIATVQALALRVLTGRLEHGETASSPVLARKRTLRFKTSPHVHQQCMERRVTPASRQCEARSRVVEEGRAGTRMATAGSASPQIGA